MSPYRETALVLREPSLWERLRTSLMLKLLGKFLCLFLDHRYGPVRVEAPEMIGVLCHQIDGSREERKVPGFVRSRTCERCGFPKIEIVFTPKARLPTKPPEPNRWLN